MIATDKGQFKENLLLAAETNGIADLINDETGEQLYTLTVRMLTVNETFNLTAIKDVGRVILLHYVDSLLAARHFPVGAQVIDVGCGAGFPSMAINFSAHRRNLS